MTKEEFILKIKKTRKSGLRYSNRLILNRDLSLFAINLTCFTAILLSYYTNAGNLAPANQKILTHYSFIISFISFCFSLIIVNANYQTKIESSLQTNRELNVICDMISTHTGADFTSYIEKYHRVINMPGKRHENKDYAMEFQRGSNILLNAYILTNYYLTAIIYLTLIILSLCMLYKGTTSFFN